MIGRNNPPRPSWSWKIILLCFGSLSIIQQIQFGNSGNGRGGSSGVLFVRAQDTFFPILGQPQSPPIQGGQGIQAGPSISGVSFFDTNTDGVKDPTEWGTWGVNIHLLACGIDVLVVATAMADTAGRYEFKDLVAGSYYVSIPTGQFYAPGDVWSGATSDITGELLYPDVDNAVNPETGRSECFYLGEGEDKTVNVGMKIAPTPPPTPAQVTVPPPTISITTSSPTTPPPTKNPTLKPTLEPTKKPTRSPTNEPTFAPTTDEPTSDPSARPSEMPSDPPSSSPSSSPTSHPSSRPSIAPSAEPSSTPSFPPTASTDPTASPTTSPTRDGDPETPVTTKNMVMTIGGIGKLDAGNEAAWSAATGEYIMSYFNSGYKPGVFDVDVSIKVVSQKTVLASATLFERNRRLLRGVENSVFEKHEFDGPDHDEPRQGRRELQGVAVEVTYEQTSEYKTTDPDTYNQVYVGKAPFESETDRVTYLAVLQELSPYYVSATRVRIPEYKEAVVVEAPSEDEDEGMDNAQISIIVVVCGACVLVAALVIIVLRRRKEKEQMELIEQSEVSAAASGSRRGNASGSPIGNTSSSDEDEEQGDIEQEQMYGSRTKNALAKSAPLSSRTLMATADSSIRMIHVIAPAGKLGVIVDTPEAGGSAFVCEIKDTCPVIGQIQLNDKIIAVDGDDVQNMSAVNISKLLARKSRQAERKITILREVDTAGSMHGSDAGSDLMSSYNRGDRDSGSGYTVDTLPVGTSDLPRKATKRMDLIAPAGKLGVVLVTPEPPTPPGPAYVFNIREDSPLKGQAQLGDKIIAVDGRDVTDMTAINVSKLLGSKSSNPQRKITVLRDMDDFDISAISALTVDPTARTSDSTAASSIDAGGERRVDIVAPPGKVGFILVNPKPPGPPYVFSVQADGVLVGQVHVGDKVVAVDDEDVQGMKASDVSKMLSSRRENPERKITVLREVGGDSQPPPSSMTASAPPSTIAQSAPFNDYRNLASSMPVQAPTDFDANNATSGTRIDIIAPPGKLGVVLDVPPEGGTAYVKSFNDTCPIKDQIRQGDKVVAIDDEDVSKKEAVDISMVLARKSNQTERKITVLRDTEAERTPVAGLASSMPVQAPTDFDANNATPGTRIDIFAPPGKLGVVLDVPPEGGTAYVKSFNDTCPIKDQIRQGDKIIAIDDEDVSKKEAVDISMVLARKSKQTERKITVLRDTGAERAKVSFLSSSMPVQTTSTFNANNATTSSSSKIDIIAPPGKLGVVLDMEDGSSYVKDVKDTSPLIGKIQLGDKIIAIDGEGVRRKEAVDISLLLARKSKQTERKITVLRDTGAERTPVSGIASSMPVQATLTFNANNAAASNRSKIDIFAPPGKLGVVLDMEDGSSYVQDVKDTSPLMGKIQLGDKIIAIDDENVSTKEAINISMLLARKSKQTERKITVSRAAGSMPTTVSFSASSPPMAPYISTAASDATPMDPYQSSNSSSSSSSSSSQSNDAAVTSSSKNKIDILAPPGKLGVVVDSPDEAAPYVSDVKETSVLRGKIQVGDKVIAIDDEDVSRKEAVQISLIIARKSKQAVRKITVLREGSGDKKDLRSFSPGGTTSTEGSPPSPMLAQNATNNSESKFDIIAPPGKLGVVIDSRPGAGSAYVSDIKAESPIRGDLRLGDKLVAIDDEDVTRRKAVDISMMLARKSRQAERKITVMRSNTSGSNNQSTASASTTDLPGQQANSPTQLDIFVPAGKLGVVVDSRPEGGEAYVSEIKDDCQIKDQIRLGDKLLAVDDEDVSKLKAVHVSMLLGSKSRNAQRKITVLRDVN